jgi:hypothetical protein
LLQAAQDNPKPSAVIGRMFGKRDPVMRNIFLAAGMGMALAATAPASAQSAGHILRGAGIGAAAGVVAGAVIPGLSIGQGALIGAAGGAIVNTLDKGHHRSYRHRRYRR